MTFICVNAIQMSKVYIAQKFEYTKMKKKKKKERKKITRENKKTQTEETNRVLCRHNILRVDSPSSTMP